METVKRMQEVKYAQKDFEGNYTLLDSDLKETKTRLTPVEFRKLSELLSNEGQISHWVIFNDYSK